MQAITMEAVQKINNNDRLRDEILRAVRDKEIETIEIESMEE